MRPCASCSIVSPLQRGVCLQVCTGVMLHGYPLVKNLCGGLQAFMASHGFTNIEDFRGAALPYFTTHSDLYARQQAAIAEKKKARAGLADDAAWTGEGFVQETESMVSN
jgi:dihydropyrimidine dehydrogenase (NADP+)